MKGQAAAYKEKLQEATTGQAQAARLAADLEVEQTLHQKAKSHLATLESRYTLLTLLSSSWQWASSCEANAQQSAVRWQCSRLYMFG